MMKQQYQNKSIEWQEGYDAYCSGHSLEACPYSHAQQKKRDQWEDGLCQAEEDSNSPG